MDPFRPRDADHPALEWDGGALTYGELAARAARLADGWRARGAAPGDRIALWLPNGPEFVAAWLACRQLGLVAVPIGDRWAPDEAAWVVALTRPALGIASDGRADQLPATERAPFGGSAARHDRREGSAETPAQILFSSGTTGRPKGVALSVANVAFVRRAKVAALGLTPADRVPLIVPLAHCYGLNAILGPALSAGATVLLRNGLPEGGGAAWLRERRATVLCGVPSTFDRLVQDGDVGLPLLRLAFAAAAPLTADVATRWRQATGHAIRQGYGLTETAPFATWEGDPLAHPGSVGRPIPGVALRTVDPETGRPMPAGLPGEVQVRGPNVMLGYWDDPAATAGAMDGPWLRTGDVGYLERDGRLYLTGRLKEMINVNGLKAWPAEVERVLADHPAVAEAAAFGVPDPRTGERVEAAVVARADGAGLADRLLAHARARLAPHKVPRRIHLLPALPRTPTGKVRRTDLATALSTPPTQP